MHVVHIVNTCRRGGAGHVILPLIKEHQKYGVKFTVTYLLGPEILKGEYEEHGAKTVLLGTNPIKAVIKLIKIIKNDQNPVSLIHTHLVHAGLIGRLVGRLYKIPVVTTRHYQVRSKLFNPFHFLEDHTAKWSDNQIAISDAVRNHLVNNNYVQEQKCHTIYNPVDLKLFSKMKTNIQIEDRNNIVCNARFIKLKGIEYLLEAFEQVAMTINSANLILVGDYSSGGNIIDIIEKHRYRDRIILKGAILREEVLEELNRARIYVQPSLSEGLGLAAIEAMGVGCPCIFSDVGGLSELAKNNKNAILVAPRDSELLANKIIKLWRDTRLAEQLVRRAKEFVNKNIDVKIIAHKYFNLYADTIKEKNAIRKIKNKVQFL